MKGRIASAHLILTIAYNILKTGEPYQELGPNYIEEKQNNKELKMIQYLNLSLAKKLSTRILSKMV